MLLGQSRGKEVRVMVHHSRNSEQKQWDETVVIALSGMARLLRAHLPAIVGMDHRVAGKYLRCLSGRGCSYSVPVQAYADILLPRCCSRLGGDDGCRGVQHGGWAQGSGAGCDRPAIGGASGTRKHHRHRCARHVEACSAGSGCWHGGCHEPYLHGAAAGECLHPVWLERF